jgi:hypothetical protein
MALVAIFCSKKGEHTMSTLDQLKAASTTAEGIVAQFSGVVPENAVANRSAALLAELEGLNKADAIANLIAKVVELEKPKSKDGITVETVARKFMEAPELALFNWAQIAELVKRVLPEANTSSKSIASYASKRKEEWSIVAREKLQLDMASISAL